MTDVRVKHVTDLAGLRAMSHPLRLRLLGLLRMQGPATATTLGRQVGAASNAVSYHLRQLAKAGFIEPARPDAGDLREHAWRASHDVTSWERSSFPGSPGTDVVLDALRRQGFDRYRQELEHYLQAESGWDAAWRAAAGSGDLGFRTTPDGLRALREEIEALIERHRRESTADPNEFGMELVNVIWHAYPSRVER